MPLKGSFASGFRSATLATAAKVFGGVEMQAVALFIYVAVVLFLNEGLGWGFFSSLFWGMPVSLGLAVAAVIGAVLYGTLTAKERQKTEDREREKLREEIGPIVQEHMRALVRKRRTLVRVDDYGIEDASKWLVEVDYFIDNVVLPRAGLHVFQEKKDWIAAELVSGPVAQAQAEQTASFTRQYDGSMSGLDYEHFCASRLKDAGWQTTVTQASRDQGADIIAERDAETVVVQCKQYAKPVGNSAVQQAVAAMRHYSANFAVVVATNGFTKSAQALAATNGVVLLSHDDLLDSDWLSPFQGHKT